MISVLMFYDLPQVLNLSLGTERKLKIAQHEDDLQWKKPQNIKNDKLSNLWSDLTQILNLKSELNIAQNEDDL